MGLHHRSLRQLASAHLVVAHDRHSIVRIKCGGTSHRQCAFPHRERAPSFFAAGSHDARAVAKCDGSSPVCVASIACRIGGLDRRTQRRAQHIFSVVSSWCLRAVHRVEPANAPLVIAAVLCRWIDGQANAGDAAIHLRLAGLLATQARLSRISPPGYREGAVLLVHRAVKYRDLCRATRWRSGCVSGKYSFTVSIGERAARLHSISTENFLAYETGRDLSNFERVLVVACCSRSGAVNHNLDCRCLFVTSPGLAFCRLVLVYRHAGPHDWS